MRATIIIILLVLGVGVGGILAQIFLSKKDSKWAGLILPILSFGISLIAVLGCLLFSATGTTTLTVNGDVVEQATSHIADTSTIIGSAVYIFLLYNIPTVVLLAIYAACRGKRKRRRDLEKMSVQDLQ